MPDFKIDKNIPLGQGLVASESLKEGPSNGPKRGRKPKCKTNADHVWEDLGNKRERCIKCGDKIPCESECFHIECLQASGKSLPDWYMENNPDEVSS